MQRILIFLTSLSLFATSQGVVHLSTANPLQTLYCSNVDDTYAQELRSILCFNLRHNGCTKVSDTTVLKEKTLSDHELHNAFSTLFWKQEGIPYVVRLSYANQKLKAEAFSTKSGTMQTFRTNTLTGKIKQDRREIHKIADAITEYFFNIKGIAKTHIYYTKQIPKTRGENPTWDSEIWECDYDGKNPRKVIPETGYAVTPYAIHGTNDFFYVTYKNGEPKIYIGNRIDGSSKPLLGIRGNQLLPTLSYNKRTMAFICDASGQADLFLQPFEGTSTLGKPMQAYSFPASVQASPTLSPDGTKIAFVSDKSGTPRVYLMDTPKYGTPSKRMRTELLSKECRENTSPHWSPDGNKIAYSARIEGIRQIVIFDLASRSEWQLTTGPGHKENPNWAPNSTHLVYNTVVGEKGDLFIVDINEKKPCKISDGQGKYHFPSWGTE